MEGDRILAIDIILHDNELGITGILMQELSQSNMTQSLRRRRK